MWVEFRECESSWMGYSAVVEKQTNHSSFVSQPKRVVEDKRNREVV